MDLCACVCGAGSGEAVREAVKGTVEPGEEREGYEVFSVGSV